MPDIRKGVRLFHPKYRNSEEKQIRNNEANSDFGFRNNDANSDFGIRNNDANSEFGIRNSEKKANSDFGFRNSEKKANSDFVLHFAFCILHFALN